MTQEANTETRPSSPVISLPSVNGEKSMFSPTLSPPLESTITRRHSQGEKGEHGEKRERHPHPHHNVHSSIQPHEVSCSYRTRKLLGPRCYSDRLCLTSGLFFISGVISFFVGQYISGVLQCCASIASTAFHRSRETTYLPIDATFSSLLMCIAIWTAWRALFLFPLVGYFLIFDGLLCGFLMVYCDLPGHPRYDYWHEVWHYSSAIGTGVTSIFLSYYFPDFDRILLEQIAEVLAIEMEWDMAGWLSMIL